jgi:hypothetical protein
MAININQLWNDKTDKLSGKLWDIAKGNEDLYQEGVLGIHDGLLRNPYATDAYLISAAKWAMSHYKNKGVSMDNGPKWQYTKTLADGTVKTYRKATIPIYIDALMEEFELEFPDYSYPPDTLAIDRICAEMFYKTMGNYFYNSKARRKLKVSRNEYHRIKCSTYQKFIQAFGVEVAL